MCRYMSNTHVISITFVILVEFSSSSSRVIRVETRSIAFQVDEYKPQHYNDSKGGGRVYKGACSEGGVLIWGRVYMGVC